MIRASRVIVDGNKTYNECKIYKSGELGVPNIFEDDQLTIVDDLGKHIVSNFSITCIELPRSMSPTPDSIKAQRINIASDITHAPVWIIPDFRLYEIPDVFGYPFQLTFIDGNKKLFVTNDVNVALIDL